MGPMGGSSGLHAALPLPNPRHEMFALYVAMGQSHKDAYAGAGYSGSTNATTLLRRREVKLRIAHLQGVARQTVLTEEPVTREWITAMLKANVGSGLAAGDHSAVNGSLELLGRQTGLFCDRKEDVAWDGDLGKLSTSQVENLTTSMKHICRHLPLDQLQDLAATIAQVMRRRKVH